MSISCFFQHIKSTHVVVGFFVLFALSGLLSFKDIGIPYDEGIMDALGRDSYNYVFHDGEWPTNEDWRYHGPIVEFTIFALQSFFIDMDDAGVMYQRVHLRHFVCVTLFFLGVLGLYVLARKHWKNEWWALLACAMLVISPRIFAHGLYNSRDIPQLTFFLLSMLTLVRLLEKPTLGRTLQHAAISAVALAVRMTAMLIPVLTLAFAVLEILRIGTEQRIEYTKKVLPLYCLYVIAVIAFVIILWPFLWTNPLQHFREAYSFMSSLGGGEVSFMGKVYNGFPWPYIPVWMFITIPLIYTLFFVIGVVRIFWDSLSHIQKITEKRRNELLFVCWFFGPIASVIVTGAGIYNEWRHLYFIYPAFILIAVTGCMWLYQYASHLKAKGPVIMRSLIGLFLGGQLLATASWMVLNHPFEYMYFSVPTTFIEGKFYLDYWALSYKQAIEFILKDNPDPAITMYSDENVAFINAYNIFTDAQERLYRAETPAQAQYIVVRNTLSGATLEPLHLFTVDGLTFNGIYKGPYYGKDMRRYMKQN